MKIDKNIFSRIETNPSCVAGLKRGIEKESLRCNGSGDLSLTPHPDALGSALTHSWITTDFSEAQLELITSVHPKAVECLDDLNDIHRFVWENLATGEAIWPCSMPCILPKDPKEIPIGLYGSSNAGIAKTVYRRGLANRYGKTMQMVSGIHYNFSFPESFWLALGITDEPAKTLVYMGMMRNFRRYSWLLIYLFGGSPVADLSFNHKEASSLVEMAGGSLGLPFATCLRMSDAGYVSAAQENLDISYNSIEAYCQALTPGLKQTYGPYQRFKPIDGNYQQLNDAILQIENEFYSNIRPKRTSSSNKRPIHSLSENGIEYLEVRCIDLDPFEASGISAEACYFIDTFLLACAISKSPLDSPKELSSIDKNQKLVAETGRDVRLRLSKDGRPRLLQEYAKEILEACSAAAEILDSANETRAYSRAFQKRFAQTREPETTLSSRLLDSVRKKGSFIDFSLDLASQHLQTLRASPLSKIQKEIYDKEVKRSLNSQKDLEQSPQVPFDKFLADYVAV